jgi:hypothetical protein
MVEAGWIGRKDSEFLSDAERAFDVFVTIDRKIERENDLARFRLGFLVVRVKSNVITSWMPIFDQLLKAAETVKPGETIHLSALRI